MAEQPIEEQIAEAEKKLEELKAKQKALANPPQEYPKWIPDTTDETGVKGSTVNSKEEEDKVKSGEKSTAVSADEKLKQEEIRKASEEKKLPSEEDKADTRADRAKARR